MNFPAWLFPVLLCLAALPAAGGQKHPDILVILTDDQGWGDIGFHGNRQLQTPHLDALARDSVRFSRFFVQPVCSPTRAEFLTGRYYQRGGVTSTSGGGERLDTDERTIGDIFKAAGYATAVIGKWHNGQQWPYHPNARGFDHFYEEIPKESALGFAWEIPKESALGFACMRNAHDMLLGCPMFKRPANQGFDAGEFLLNSTAMNCFHSACSF